MILFSLLNIFSLVRGLETAKYPQIEAFGDRIEFWFAPTKEAQSSPANRPLISLNHSDTNEMKTCLYKGRSKTI